MHFAKKQKWICYQWLRFLTIRLIKKRTGNEKNSKIKKSSNRKWKIFFNILNKIQFYSFLIETSGRKEVKSNLKMGFKYISPTQILLVTLVIVGTWSEDGQLISDLCKRPGIDYHLIACDVLRRSFPTSKLDF